jgi:hypothetical protein
MNTITKIPYLKIVEQAEKTPDAVAVLHGENSTHLRTVAPPF